MTKKIREIKKKREREREREKWPPLRKVLGLIPEGIADMWVSDVARCGPVSAVWSTNLTESENNTEARTVCYFFIARQ